MYAHRIRSLARDEGDPDDSPLISGHPPESRLMNDREGSTTPERPPPLRTAQSRWTTALPRHSPSKTHPASASARTPAVSGAAPDRGSSCDTPLARSDTFKARPAPSTTWAPEHRVRQSRASLLRAGLDLDALGSSTGSNRSTEHAPTDFTAVPGERCGLT